MQIHPAQISPGEPFDVFYFLRNHTDAATYYVRAVVHDVRSGEVLKTIELEQSATNPRLFIKTVQAPADPIGYGRNIVAIATVYTDGSYSQKSQDYEEQEQYFLIRAEPPVLGGSRIDYGTLREIVDDVVEKHIAGLPKPEPVELPEFPNMPFETVFGAIGALAREVNRIPKESPNLEGVENQLEAVREAIGDIAEAPEPADLEPVLGAISELAESLAAIPETIRQSNANVISAIKAALAPLGPEIARQVAASVEETIQSQELSLPFAVNVSSRRKRSEEQPQPDISTLFKR